MLVCLLLLGSTDRHSHTANSLNTHILFARCRAVLVKIGFWVSLRECWGHFKHQSSALSLLVRQISAGLWRRHVQGSSKGEMEPGMGLFTNIHTLIDSPTYTNITLTHTSSNSILENGPEKFYSSVFGYSLFSPFLSLSLSLSLTLSLSLSLSLSFSLSSLLQSLSLIQSLAIMVFSYL